MFGVECPHTSVECPHTSQSYSLCTACRPETEEGKAKLQQLLDDLHLSFKDLVRQSRGQALKGTEDELFSGLFGCLTDPVYSTFGNILLQP